MFNIARDGQHIITVSDQFELLRWFHREHSYSISHAVRWEGYSVTDAANNEVEV